MEEGTNFVNYAVYFYAIIICIVVYAFMNFHNSAYVLEEHCETALHIIESEMLSFRTASTVLTGASPFDGTVLEDNKTLRDLERAHIVPSAKYQASKTADENKDVKSIGNAISSRFKAAFNLTGSVPNEGFIKSVVTDASAVTISSCKIYEPVYDISMTIDGLTGTGRVWDDIIKNWDSTTVGQWTDPDGDKEIKVTHAITGWVVYTLNFNSNNAYVSYTKELFDVAHTPSIKRDPSLGKKGDRKVEGATIEMSMNINLKGVKQIFAGSDEAGIFARNPVNKSYDLTITQATDIVIADEDSRKRNDLTLIE